MEQLTLEEELYGMSQNDINGFKERLAILSRNMRAKGLTSFRCQEFEIGEDAEHGTLTVDALVGAGLRRVVMMIDREGNLMVPARYRSVVKTLSQVLILEELAAI